MGTRNRTTGDTRPSVEAGVAPATGDEPWADLDASVFTAESLREYRDARQKDGISASTVNRDLNTLSAFYDWLARKQGIVLVRPEFKWEGESKGRDRWLSGEEWRSVQAAFAGLNQGVSQLRGRRSGGSAGGGLVPTSALWPLFVTIVLTGLRLGEALALEWGDLDMARGVIHVRRSLRHTKRGKTDAALRDVPLGKELAERLEAHRTIFAGESQTLRARVFPPQVFNPRRMQALWSRAVAAAQIEHATIHDLRHTFAVHALDKGVTINTLQAILGHSDATMVMRYVRRLSERHTAASGDLVAASVFAL
ncbi:MAG: site-specific integrase [Bryobacteraceae bacterium]|nr:site-specific integrase [Bryobacteraceae bacterium]